MEMFIKIKSLFRIHCILVTFSISILTSLSCGPVRLISEYDEITDRTITVLQEQVTTYFVSLERNIGTDQALYKHYTDDFDKMKVNLSILEIRAASFEKNEIMQQSVVELKSMIDNLEKLHMLGFKSYEQVAPLRQPFNATFTALTKLLIALKRGK